MKASVDHGDGDRLPAVLDETMAALREAGIQFLLIGGVGSCVFGRDRGTRDIDVFVRPESAENVLSALAARGFRTKKEYEHWLYKAWKDDVLVDVIFRSSRDILLDQEMLDRARMVTFRGREVPVAPPEDLIVMKAVAASEDTPRYWYDAIAMIAQTELDWEYLVARARQRGARRILSLLLFADSVDLVVPPEPIEALYEAIGSRRLA
ncbi:MAG: nucleotidyl transferase AbiEii/AbiGii toxin family protein [Actinomycetota bacterium]